MRYRLRTLLIVLAIMPPLLWFGWTKYQTWQAELARRAALSKTQMVAPLFANPDTGANSYTEIPSPPPNYRGVVTPTLTLESTSNATRPNNGNQ